MNRKTRNLSALPTPRAQQARPRGAPGFAKKSCVVATQLALAMMAAPMAFAQQETPVRGEKVEVTGSRIPQPNLESPSPVSVITSQDIKTEGVTKVEDLLNNLPQVFADFGSTLSNGATGTATVNLRNLGADRTLVLVNGRRLPAGSPLLYATDLNEIPAPLIERVEVLTGGASAVYGSDAVAGVVNFIMKENFEGVQGEVNYGFFQHNQGNALADVIRQRAATNPAQFRVPGDVNRDGDSTNVNLLIGGNFANGKGNATTFFEYQKDYAVLQRDRDYSACATSASGNHFSCGGSSTSYPGRFIDLNTGSSFTIANAAGGVRPFVGSQDQFNYAPYNYFQRPDERYGFNAFVHYDVTPQARAYGEFSFHDDHTLAQIAPSGAFGVEFLPSADNPLLSQSFRDTFGISSTTPGDILLLRRNVEGGGRQDDLRHTSFRTVLGVKGTVLKNWNYDAYMQAGKVLYQEEYLNDFSKVRIGRALDVVADPTTGQPVCRSFLNGTDPNCVPWNIFQLGGVTQAALSYLETPGFEKGSTQQSIQGITLSSDLGENGIHMPGAKSGVGVALGAERRVEKLDLETDTEFSTFDLAGQGGPVIGLAGKYTVNEYFGEVRVPILEDVPMAQQLSVNGSYRYSDYSTGKKTNSYGLGLQWAPIKPVMFRGSYQQAVRAANIIELFQAQGLNLFSMSSDPCGENPTATFAECQRTGVTAAQYGSALLTNPAGQYNFLQGGNPNLDPETAKTYTAGVVLQPARNLSASVDYFNIKLKDVISTLPTTIVLQQCLATGQFCDLIHRDTNGTLWLTGFISATNINIATRDTSGVDVNVNYNHDLGRMGGLALSFVGTYLRNFNNEPIPGLGKYDCAGLYGATCGTPLPKWRHKARVTWGTPWDVDVSLSWRHFDSVKLDSTSSNPLLAGDFEPITEKLAARDYIDLAASWIVNRHLTVRAGVNNVFDKDPPITDSSIAGPPYGNGNTYPQVYDALGRRVFMSATMKF